MDVVINIVVQNHRVNAHADRSNGGYRDQKLYHDDPVSDRTHIHLVPLQVAVESVQVLSERVQGLKPCKAFEHGRYEHYIDDNAIELGHGLNNGLQLVQDALRERERLPLDIDERHALPNQEHTSHERVLGTVYEALVKRLNPENRVQETQ